MIPRCKSRRRDGVVFVVGVFVAVGRGVGVRVVWSFWQNLVENTPLTPRFSYSKSFYA